MSRKAKGKRPTFFKNPEVDRILAIVMAVAGELSVLRDRMDTLERIAERKGYVTREEIEAFPVDEAVEADRQQWREEYLERVLRVIHHELESQNQGESHEAYAAAVQEHMEES